MKFTLSAVTLLLLPLTVLAVPTFNVVRDEIKTPDGKLGSFCGGIVGFPCNKGMVCKLEGDFADAGGVCVKKPKRA
ncbi:unnamed protein product [Rhizoctonia solani]|uniref:Uncharacterized protein n=1 Tax=Rhizoctonia solani TaxID=456999 RepID=A0A8H3HGB4_9AGAM|nr:unnamed protein product [Rhizoctonia solani]